LHVGSKSCLYEFTELNFLSVGSQLPPRTLNISIDYLNKNSQVYVQGSSPAGRTPAHIDVVRVLT